MMYTRHMILIIISIISATIGLSSISYLAVDTTRYGIILEAIGFNALWYDTNSEQMWMQYGIHFSIISIFLMIIPLCCCVILRISFTDIGFKSVSNIHRSLWFYGLLIFSILMGFNSSFITEFQEYYPYLSNLPALVHKDGLSWLFLHAGLYLLAYYVPWEIFFRGIMLIPLFNFLDDKISNKKEHFIYAMAIIAFQVLPSTLAHTGHPFMEFIGAIPFGFIVGIYTYYTRSIIPAIIVHFAAGISLDSGLVFM